MIFIELESSHLDVLSSFFTDLAAAWFITSLGARELLTLTTNLVATMLCLGTAFSLKTFSRNYD